MKSSLSAQSMMITSDIVRKHHIFGCQLIQEAGIIHKLPQIVMISGQSIFHRFYHKQSIVQYDVFTTAMGSFLLASKVEEKILSLKEVVFTFHYLFFQKRNMRRRELEIGSELYLSWKNELISIEKDILVTLGFAVYEAIDHPHQYLLYIIKLLLPSSAVTADTSRENASSLRDDRLREEEADHDPDREKRLAQLAWNYLNDSMRIDLELRYHSTYIACAAVFLASRQVEFPIPETPEPWWKTLLQIDTTHLYEIANEIMCLYSAGQIEWIKPYVEMSYLNSTAGTNGN